MTKICSAPNCKDKAHAGGDCSKHYAQMKNHGHYLTEEEKHLNRSIAAKKRKSSFKKGHTAWNKGMKNPWTEEHIEATRKANIGRVAWNKGLKGVMPRPHNKIGDGITPADKLERKRFQKTVQRDVFERDNYTCQMCFVRGGYLQVDHIKSWSKHHDLRFEIDNCRTLCMACHYYITFKRKIPEGIIWGHNLSRRIAS